LLANPLVDRWLPPDGAPVVIPARHIFPQAERTGLVINLPEMRLYYFPKPEKGKKPVVITYPISIGRMDWRTPLGRTTVIRKQKDPTWIPPQSLKNEAIAAGNPPLPDIVPPGPKNPLGRHALYLGTTGYLIHGTDKPFGIGMRVTHGCLRMYPEEVEKLFDQVAVGTPVQLVNQPIKLGWLADSLFIELHPPLEENENEYADYMQKVRESIASFLEKSTNGRKINHAIEDIIIDESALELAVFEKNGIPVLISK
jgi:L,D-transpeptidase ErfK/SrfK